MPDIDERLTACFRAVFPSLSGDGARSASAESVDGWDSVAFITLATVIEEEFDIDIDLDVLPELDSYAALSAYVRDCV